MGVLTVITLFPILAPCRPSRSVIPVDSVIPINSVIPVEESRAPWGSAEQIATLEAPG